jgi:hypothetical protein
LIALGAEEFHFKLSSGAPQQIDVALSYSGKTVAVEVEKANRETILRDLFKSNMYLSAGADLAALFLPRNYPHKHSVWDFVWIRQREIRRMCQVRARKSRDISTNHSSRLYSMGFRQRKAAYNRCAPANAGARTR